MTYETLTANVDIMRSGNEDILKPEKYADTALLDLYKTSAKSTMKLDLEAALTIEYDDTTTIDDITDRNQLRLSRALSYKQLSTYYQANDDGEGNKNRYRWEMYQKLYNTEKSMFGTLSKTAPTTLVSSQVFMR